MKIFVILCFAITYVQCLSEEQKELLIRKQSECIEETKTSNNAIEKLRKGDWGGVSPALKKFALCYLVKADLMTPEGVFQLDVALSKVPDEDKNDLDKLIDKCLTATKGNDAPHENAWKYLKCYQQSKPKHSLF